LDSPPQFDDALCACTTVDDLYAVEIPETLRNELFDVVTAPDYDEAMSQPYYVTGGIQNLQRFVDGELLGFLLKLSPEQEKAAYWSLNAQGPTLLRGGPGTGKTVVALYRVLAIVEACRAKGSREGAGSLRILFTTYTNALVSYCEQQLQQLLGPEAECVTVRTADSLVKEIVASTQAEWRPAHESVEKQALQRAMDGVQQSPAKYGLQRHVELRSISNLSSDYLLEEFGGVIDGRELESLEDYLDTPRAGRLVRLSKAQRTAIWDLYCAFCKEIALLKHSTWHQLRRRAAEIARSVGSDVERFDAVVVDEAQDLDPAVLRLIVALCKAPNRVFLAADMNQSIYSGGFRWTDIHADLRFRGRAITLWVNQRSTREIGEASYSYLRGGALEDLDRNRLYVLSGQKPILWHATPEDEVRGLGAFLHDAARDWRLGLGNCALLVPTHSVGQELAKQLRERNIPAQFMTSRELSLSKPVVKVLPLKSAKGLEFPIVAIAGFREAQAASREYDADEREERAGYDRRALFVAMTRAMRALLIVIPPGASVPNLRGFDDSLWDIRRGT
jgi:superfamily I DNA/RNA helicase